MSDDIQYQLADILTLVYTSVPHKKMKSIRRFRDVFNHRVRAASRQPSLERFVSKLCNFFSIQSLPDESVRIIQALKPYEKEALDMIYREHIYVCALCFLRVEKYRDAKRTANIFQKKEKVEPPIEMFQNVEQNQEEQNENQV